VKKEVAFESGLKFTDDEYFSLLTREKDDELLSTQFVSNIRKSAELIRRAAIRSGTPTDVVIDVTLAAMHVTMEGEDKGGYRVQVEAPSLPGIVGTRTWTAYVVRQNGQYRTADFGPDGGALGALALERAGQGDLAGARRLLDWQREKAFPGNADDPLAGWAFAGLWTIGMEGNQDAIRYAVASLMTTGPYTEKALSVLNEGRAKSDTDAARTNFDIALARAYGSLDRYEDVLTVTKRLIQVAPQSRQAFGWTATALMHLQRWQDCEQLAGDRLKGKPDDLDALRALSALANQQGQWDKGQTVIDRVTSSGKATGFDWNNSAWNALLRGKITPEVLQAAQRASSLTQNNAAYTLHTLASIYAEVGKTAEARAVLLQAMDADGLSEPSSEYWYVF